MAESLGQKSLNHPRLTYGLDLLLALFQPCYEISSCSKFETSSCSGSGLASRSAQRQGFVIKLPFNFKRLAAVCSDYVESIRRGIEDPNGTESL